jgi:hypothetical protein
LKKGMFAGKQTAQICRSDDDMPKFLLPIIKSVGTVSPINRPDRYQGQGFCRISIILLYYVVGVSF